VPAWPDAALVTRSLARLWRGRLRLAAVNGGAAGFVLAGGMVLALWIGGHSPAVLLVAAAVAGSIAASVALAASRRASLPFDVERRAPRCQNLVVTAAELLRDPTRVSPEIGTLVCQHAAIRLDTLGTRAVFPLGRAVVRGLVAAIGCLAILGATRARPLTHVVGRGRSATGGGADIRHITVTIHAPEYAGLPDRTLRDPADVEALAGSRLRLLVDSGATAVTLETIDGRQSLTPASGSFSGDVVVSRDGYLSLQPTEGAVAGVRRTIGLVADPDHPPLVHITKPGRDLFLPDGRQRVSIELEAEDDLGLASLRLAYTKASGAGENFEFGEGEVPITIAKPDDRHWRASVDWSLGALSLAPGDLVVYRGIAADRRPGTTPVESDAFIVQILTPNQASVDGFAGNDDPNKYALSQRMVILKTERLLAKQGTLLAADFADEALNIAAEERQVRAMFVFMLGGEFEDASVGDTLNEVAEAESEGDIAAGRLRNQARVDLANATRRMSSASTSLAVPDVPAALTAEKAALDDIQRAFTKDRYLLRAMSSSERVDLSRRLGGTLTDVARGPRPAATSEPPATMAALRRLLARLAAVSEGDARSSGPRGQSDRSDRSAALASIADDCLRADPSSPALREVAATLTQAATGRAAAAGSPPLLDRATAALAAIIRASSPDAPATMSSDLRRLNGALADAITLGWRGPLHPATSRGSR
jgi:hypothetical protein